MCIWRIVLKHVPTVYCRYRLPFTNDKSTCSSVPAPLLKLKSCPRRWATSYVRVAGLDLSRTLYIYIYIYTSIFWTFWYFRRSVVWETQKHFALRQVRLKRSFSFRQFTEHFIRRDSTMTCLDESPTLFPNRIS